MEESNQVENKLEKKNSLVELPKDEKNDPAQLGSKSDEPSPVSDGYGILKCLDSNILIF
jgi:hypothetical protein